MQQNAGDFLSLSCGELSVLCCEGHILVKNDSKILHSVTGSQSRHLVGYHISKILGLSIKTSVPEFRNRKLEVFQVLSLRHSCSLITNFCVLRWVSSA